MKFGLKDFLAASAAVHVALLVAWTQTAPEPGNPGRVILLDLVHHTGQDITAAIAATTRTPAHAPQSEIQTPPARVAHPARTVAHITRKVPAATQQAAKNPDVSAHQTAQSIAAAPASTRAASPRPSHEASDRHVRESIMNLVTRRFSYPPLARRNGWQGIVTLGMRIESNGSISELQVNETSGYAALDRAALNTLRLASLPGVAHWLRGRSIDLQVPVEYRLLDS